MQQLLRDREPHIPPDESMAVAQCIKERHSYVCSDIVKEFTRYDTEPAKYLKKYDGVEPISKKVLKKKFCLFVCSATNADAPC